MQPIALMIKKKLNLSSAFIFSIFVSTHYKIKQYERIFWRSIRKQHRF